MPPEKSQIFFCYSRADSEFALKLAKDLRKAGANIWIDQLDVLAGQRWDMVTEEALVGCDCLLTILSPSAQQSQNVRDEQHYALDENKELVPVLLQKCDIPYRIRRFQYIDFRSSYEQGWTRLLEALGIAQPTEQLAQTKSQGQAEKESPQPTDETEARQKTEPIASTKRPKKKPPASQKQQATDKGSPARRTVWLESKFVWVALFAVILVATGIYFIKQLNIQGDSEPEKPPTELLGQKDDSTGAVTIPQQPDTEDDEDQPLLETGSLKVTSEPPEANVWLNEKLVGGTTPFKDNEIITGEYNLILQLAGYQNFKQTLDISKGELTSIAATLTRELGSIDITSEPFGAKILLDGEKIGTTTPDEIEKVEAGQHEIVLQKAGFGDYTTSVTVEPGKSVKVRANLEALLGTLTVLVRPFGSIYLNGKLKKQNALLPYTDDLKAGRYTVKVVHPDLGTWEKIVEIEPDKTEDIRIDFRTNAVVTILCNAPSGRPVAAKIFVDGEPMGKSTPKEIQLRIGKHTIEVRREGFELVGEAKVINLEEGGKETIQFILKRE